MFTDLQQTILQENYVIAHGYYGPSTNKTNLSGSKFNA